MKYRVPYFVDKEIQGCEDLIKREKSDILINCYQTEMEKAIVAKAELEAFHILLEHIQLNNNNELILNDPKLNEEDFEKLKGVLKK